MKLFLNQSSALQLIKGASLFTTGGGVPLSDQKLTLSKIKNLKVRIYSLDQFPKSDYLCTAAELGPTDVPPLIKDHVIKKMLDLLIKTTGKKIVGIYPPEIGQESVVIESASLLKLPIADFDPVGFRAVPFIDINVFNLKKLPFRYTPMAVASDNGEIFLIDGEISYNRLETILRKMTEYSKSGVVFLLGGLLSVNNLIKNKLETNSLSRAHNLGKINKLSKLLQELNPVLTINATVVKKSEFKQQGFLGEVISLIDNINRKYKLIVLNETIFLLDENKKILAQVPQRILLIDPVKTLGLSGVFLKKGQKICVAVIPPEKQWQTPEADKLFGKKRFLFLLKNL
jgi:DUF917 family protein